MSTSNSVLLAVAERRGIPLPKWGGSTESFTQVYQQTSNIDIFGVGLNNPNPVNGISPNSSDMCGWTIFPHDFAQVKHQQVWMNPLIAARRGAKLTTPTAG